MKCQHAGCNIRATHHTRTLMLVCPDHAARLDRVAERMGLLDRCVSLAPKYEPTIAEPSAPWPGSFAGDMARAFADTLPPDHPATDVVWTLTPIKQRQPESGQGSTIAADRLP